MTVKIAEGVGRNSTNGVGKQPSLTESQRGNESHPTEFRPSSIPRALRELNQWVCWELDEGNKIPKDPRREERCAKTNDPRTWADFETAVETASKYGWGIGFVFTEDDPFVWIDIDNCAKNKQILDWCPSLERFKDTYVEWSPSRNGLHIIFLGVLPSEVGTYNETVDGTYREILPADSGRFTTVTGELLTDAKSQIEDVDFREWVEEIEDESIKQEITQGWGRADRSPPSKGSDTTTITDSPIDDGLSSCYDVRSITRRDFPEDQKVTHPFHDSTTGANFRIFAGGTIWHCYRSGHECSGNYLHLLGMEMGVLCCGDWSEAGLSSKISAEIYDAARDAGYDIPEPKSNEDPSSIGTIAAKNSQRHTELTREYSEQSAENAYPSLSSHPIDEDYLNTHLIEQTVSVDYDLDIPRLSPQGMLADVKNDGLGSRTWSEAKIDNNAFQYPTGFAHYTPAATTFYERDSENAPNWKLQHGVDNCDYADDCKKGHRIDPAKRDKLIYINSVLDGLAITRWVREQTETTIMANDMRGFSYHHGGLVGAALGYATYYAFDDIDSATKSNLVQSNEFQQRCETHTIDPESLIEYTFGRES